MKVFLIVEGDSDKVLLDGQRNWFHSLGLELNIIPAYGKQKMIKTATKHYKNAILCGANNVLFLPDQNGDLCALFTRRKIGMDSKPGAVTIVLKRELEAWILADGQCIRETTNWQYSPAGQTDVEVNPKEKLHSILKRRFGYLPTEIESSTMFTPHFSINRAATNNTSAKRFKEFVETISHSASDERRHKTR